MLLKKRTLFSKIPAVSAHESKSGSCSSELSLQALGSSSAPWEARGPQDSEKSESISSLPHHFIEKCENVLHFSTTVYLVVEFNVENSWVRKPKLYFFESKMVCVDQNYVIHTVIWEHSYMTSDF